MWYQTGRRVVCGMTQGDKVTRWFYEQAESRRLTGTAQRLWHVLYHLLGTAHANRFYAVSSRQLAARMGVCLKSVELCAEGACACDGYALSRGESRSVGGCAIWLSRAV